MRVQLLVLVLVLASARSAAQCRVLAPPDDDILRSFGHDAAISSGRIAIGSPGCDVDFSCGVFVEGAVYLYERGPLGLGWLGADVIHASNGFSRNGFGEAVALSGPRALIGAPDPPTFPFTSSGQAYVFELFGAVWSETAILQPVDPGPVANFGGSVDLRGDTAAVSATGPPCPTLAGDPDAISLSGGGAHTLTLDAGSGHAGESDLVLGTFTGTLPGFVLPPAVPLGLDSCFLFTLSFPNTFIQSSLGTLDGAGRATATISIGAGQLAPSLAGSLLHHAYVAGDLATLRPTIVSNPTPLRLGI